MMIALCKVPPAPAAGCSIALRPSEFTSLTALLLAEAALEAGTFMGIVNVVTGRGGSYGGAFSNHPPIAKLSFIGSIATGKACHSAALSNQALVGISAPVWLDAYTWEKSVCFAHQDTWPRATPPLQMSDPKP